MDRSFRSVLVLLAGVALLGIAAAAYAIVLQAQTWTLLLAVAGLALTAWGAYRLRAEFSALIKQRRGEIALHALGVVGVLVALAYLSVLFPVRIDMSSGGRFSLAPQTVQMLKRLEAPVRITFFHDPMMRETVELYRLIGAQTDKITLEFIDPMLNPAQARRRGVEFAGTAIMESEGRRLIVNGPTETDIANGILRVAQNVQQAICFVDGHGEADPFSLESHDHTETNASHSHGLGDKLVVHERHGMAKARHGLEALNYTVRKVLLLQSGTSLADCAVLVVAGPKTPLLPREVEAIESYLDAGGNALFMLDPFVRAGVEPVLQRFGIVLDENIVIDPSSHFWTDVSAPAVTDYNRHRITTDLPLSFFPGVRSLSPTEVPVPGVSVRPIINTSKQSFVQTDTDKVDADRAGRRRGTFTIMAIANRRPEFVSSAEAVLRELRGEKVAPESRQAEVRSRTHARLAVIGDSDFATNSFYHVMGNGKLFLNTVNYLAARENLIGLEPRTFDRPQVNLTNQQMKGTFFLSIVLIPALMALIGVAVWWRQR